MTPAISATRIVTALLAAATITGLGCRVARAQGKDLRDTVTLRNGKILRGRVTARFEPEVIWLNQGGSRKKVRRNSVRDLDTVNDALRAWLEQRTPGLTVEREWELATDARRAGLASMARLQALHVLLRSPEHEGAHKLLGHKQRRRGPWLWRLGPEADGDLRPFDRFQSYHADAGHPLVLPTEHYVVRSNGALRDAVDLAFDLERLYLAWMDEWGERIRAREVVVPMRVWAYADEDKFPALSSAPRPYYEPSAFLDGGIGGENTVFTWFPEPEEANDTRPRPVEVFETATAQLIYSTLVTERGLSGGGRVQQRLGAWIEIGIGPLVRRGAWAGNPGTPSSDSRSLEPTTPASRSRIRPQAASG